LYYPILSEGQFQGVARCVAAFSGFLAGMLLNIVVTRFILKFASIPVPPFTLPDISYARSSDEPDLYLKSPLLRQMNFRRASLYYQDQLSYRSLFVTGSCTLLFLGMSFLFDNPMAWLIVCLFSCFLITLSVIDASTCILPDALTQPLLWLGLILSALGHGVPVESAIFGAVSGYLSLWFLYWCLRLVMKKEGMGFGDFKLLAAIGAWSGWEALPAVCTLAALIGIFYAVVWGRFLRRGSLIPFGPALSISGLLIYISQRSDIVWLM
jgi:prepilin signal peptidase PulO-like enzyme (type II secretory pathway)